MRKKWRLRWACPSVTNAANSTLRNRPARITSAITMTATVVISALGLLKGIDIRPACQAIIIIYMRRIFSVLIPMSFVLLLYMGDFYLVISAMQPDCSVAPVSACCKSAEAGAVGAATCCKTRCPAAADHSNSPQLASWSAKAVPPVATAELAPSRPIALYSQLKVNRADSSPSNPLYLQHSVLLI